MINNIPTADDFYTSGKELLDFSWDTVAELITNLDEAEYFGIDSEEVSEAYWDSAKRRLTTALSITQQGIEFILKGKIADISPYILIAGSPSNWPYPYDGAGIEFSQFRTIDAQDLIRVHDTFSEVSLDSNFVERFNSLREKRNSIMHSVDKSLRVQVTEVIDSLLYMHKSLFPDETWGQVRCDFLEKSPDVQLGSIDYVKNRVCLELSLVFKLLPPAKVKNYFGVDKNQRMYFCPKCYHDANHDAGDFDYKLAVLNPEGADSKKVYCPVCNINYDVVREDCDTSETENACPGNVISTEYGMCLTCGG